jgi:hypothetical protein
VSATLPFEIEVLESADGVHFRLPPPAGDWKRARHEVCVTSDGKLRWQTDSDPASTTTEVAIADVARFGVSPFGPLALLFVKTRQGATHTVCAGYPRKWLEALAAELSRRCGVPSGPPPNSRPRLPALPPLPDLALPLSVDAVRKLGEDMRALYEHIQTAAARVPEFQEEPNQPPSSQVICQRRDNGVTLIVPPSGAGLFFLLGCGLCAFAVLATLAGLMTGFHTDDGNYGPLVLVLILSAVALAVFLPAYHNARAQVALAVTGDQLEMLERSRVRTRHRVWNRADLTDIRSGDNGWASGGDESNLQPVAELHIFPRAERKVGLLAGRDAREVRWIATVLRRALRLPRSECNVRV